GFQVGAYIRVYRTGCTIEAGMNRDCDLAVLAHRYVEVLGKVYVVGCPAYRNKLRAGLVIPFQEIPDVGLAWCINPDRARILYQDNRFGCIGCTRSFGISIHFAKIYIFRSNFCSNALQFSFGYSNARCQQQRDTCRHARQMNRAAPTKQRQKLSISKTDTKKYGL